MFGPAWLVALVRCFPSVRRGSLPTARTERATSRRNAMAMWDRALRRGHHAPATAGWARLGDRDVAGLAVGAGRSLNAAERKQLVSGGLASERRTSSGG